MLSAEGKVEKWFGIFTDIHDRKLMELDLSQRTTQLLRSNERLNQFAYAVSHDLQEPLRTIGSYTQLLARRNEGKLGADSDQFIRFILNGVDRMRKLIDDLLQYSRTGNEPVGDKVATDANLILGLALQQLQSRIEESGAKITFDQLPVVVSNQDLLVRVFQNLIGNAIKYSDERPAEIHVSCKREAGEWVFSVKDNGIGIGPQYHDRIFEPFQRLRHTRDTTPEQAWASQSANGLSNAMADECGWNRRRGRAQHLCSRSPDRPSPCERPLLASRLLRRLWRPVGRFNTELLCVLRVQSLPAAELHRLRANDAADGSSG